MKFYSNVLLFIIVTKLNDNEYQLGINFRGEIIFFKVVITFWKDFEMIIAKNSPMLPLFYKILSEPTFISCKSGFRLPIEN